jgi:hypothetical protein
MPGARCGQAIAGRRRKGKRTPAAMLSWLSGRTAQDKAEEASQVRCRMGVHERGAIVSEGRDLYSNCTQCGRRLVRVAGEWRVALTSSASGAPAVSRQSGSGRTGLPS